MIEIRIDELLEARGRTFYWLAKETGISHTTLWGRMNREVGSYDEDNAETARFEGDDVGLPESPIFSNYSKNLWRTHTRHGLVQSPNRSREGTGDHMPTPGKTRPN